MAPAVCAGHTTKAVRMLCVARPEADHTGQTSCLPSCYQPSYLPPLPLLPPSPPPPHTAQPSAPGALHQETGQYAALEVLQLLGQGLAQAEEALAAATRVAAGGGGSGDGGKGGGKPASRVFCILWRTECVIRSVRQQYVLWLIAAIGIDKGQHAHCCLQNLRHQGQARVPAALRALAAAGAAVAAAEAGGRALVPPPAVCLCS